MNDKVPTQQAYAQTGSLLLIKPSRLSLRVGVENGKRKVRADFDYRRVNYQLVVTDPVVESVMLGRENGNYPINRNPVYLCVSLGELFDGYAYKLVAGVINFS